jgi:LytS/YehU family sensor histidine kinase
MQNDKLSANIYLSKFAGLMRKVLENSEHQLISLSKEVEMLKLYIELEEQRFDNKFICNWNISENSNLSAHLIPPLIFQPYIENAIWHGLLHKEGERILTISIKKKENHLLCSIEDNGIGRKAAADISKNKIKHESLGTKITQKRIQLINSLNKTEIGIQYHDLSDSQGNPCGTLVELIIPATEMSILED